jgi:succinate dehydrogenase / fumarate reductase, flavoprotein subunit
MLRTVFSKDAAPTRMNVSNVLVIGTGAAGLRAAIAAHEGGTEVVVVGARLRKDAHTVLAAGGINAALGTRDPEDSPQQHFADTLKEGYNLSDPRVVEIMAEEAPGAILELAEWGCPFARLPSGELDQRFFGAHMYRRTCYAGDYTGRAMLFTLVGKVDSLNIPIHEGQYVSKLLVHDGRCFGAYAFDTSSGERTVYLADAVVLATGGHTRLWRVSSSRRDENTGSGMYLALEAGCRLSDMELVQFHPTGMVYPEEWVGTLATEAIRGEGGRLYKKDGERYMERYDPERMELSTRDRVALANYTEISEGRGTEHGGIYLDISHRPKEHILEKLPRMYRQFLEAMMLDISKSPMEVAPTAHYTMGGIVVEPETHATEVEGLYAVGENTSGLHGANRLGGNSLTETVVFGRRAGEAAAEFSAGCDMQLRSRPTIKAASEELDSHIKEGGEFARPLQRALRNTMQQTCGVVRSEPKLEEGLRRLSEIRAASADVDVRPTSEGYGDLAHALDLRGSLVVAEATILGAIERRETRGAHNRSDYPQIAPDLNVNLVISRDGGGLTVTREPVHAIPEHLEQWTKADAEHEVAGRLLE